MSENRSIRRNKSSNLTKRTSGDAKRNMEEEADQKYQLVHENMRQDEGGGVIAPKDQYLVDNSKKYVHLFISG